MKRTADCPAFLGSGIGAVVSHSGERYWKIFENDQKGSA